MRKSIKKIMLFLLTLISAVMICTFSFAATYEELKEKYVTREEWSDWVDIFSSNFSQIEYSTNVSLYNEIRFQMWIRNIKDETDPVVADKQREQYMMKLHAMEEGNVANVFPVTFVMSGGMWKLGKQPLMYRKGNEETELPDGQDIYITNKVFVGWYDNINFDGGVVTSIPANTYKPTIYYAMWRDLNPGEDPDDYTDKTKLTYHLDGGSWATGYSPTTYYKQETGMPLPSSTNVSRPGYSFDGWYKTSAYNDSDKLTSIPDHVSPAIKDVYAKWSEKSYTITYNLGGASFITSYHPTDSLPYTQSIALPDESKLNYPDHIFVGWYNNSSYTGSKVTSIPAGVPYNKNYYAKWAKSTYNVTLIENGGSYVGITEPTSRQYLSAFTLPTNTQIKKTGCTLDGWYDNSSFSGSKYTTIAAKTEGDMTFYAKWVEATYTMNYHLDNGSTSASLPANRKYSQSVTLPNIDQMTPDSGYKFRGWFAEASHTTLITSVAANSTTTDVYAGFEPMNNWGTKGSDGNWNGVSYSSWMSKIPDDMYLSEINIPGAHDAGCYNVSPEGTAGSALGDLGKEFAKTQAHCIIGDSDTQFEMGVRAFDLRLDDDGNLCHGDDGSEHWYLPNLKYACKSGSSKISIDKVFDKASKFLHAHPSETIILLVTNEHGSGTVDNAKSKTNACITKYVSGYSGRTNYKGVYAGTTIPKLGSIRGKIVVLSDGLGLSNCINYHKMDEDGETLDGVTYVVENHYDVNKDNKWSYIQTALNKCTTKINTQINKANKTAKSGNIWTTSNMAVNLSEMDLDNLPTEGSPNKIDTHIDPLRRGYNWVQGNAYGIIWMDFVRTSDTNYVIASNP